VPDVLTHLNIPRKGRGEKVLKSLRIFFAVFFLSPQCNKGG